MKIKSIFAIRGAVIAIAVLFQTSIPALASPSFDCAKASNPTERAICGSSNLSRLDVDLSRSYRAYRNTLSSSQRETLLSQQRAWLRQRNSCGGNNACIEQAYLSRIGELTSQRPNAHQQRAGSGAPNRPSATQQRSQDQPSAADAIEGFLGFILGGSNAPGRTGGSPSTHSPSFVACNSGDSCFEVVRRNNNFVTVRCIRGTYRGSEQCISTDGGQWASHCNAIRQHLYSMQQAGNLACR